MRLGVPQTAPCKDATVSTENMLSGCGRYQRRPITVPGNHEVRVVAFQGVGNMLTADSAWSALFGKGGKHESKC